MANTLYRDTIKRGHDKVGVSGTEPWEGQGELVGPHSVLEPASGKTSVGVCVETPGGRKAGQVGQNQRAIRAS